MKQEPAPKVGDIWHRVDGLQMEDGLPDVELHWQTWRVTKVTPKGAWLVSVEWPYKKPRFALAVGARWASRSKAEALELLIDRKRRQIGILEWQIEVARMAMGLAKLAVAGMNGSAA